MTKYSISFPFIKSKKKKKKILGAHPDEVCCACLLLQYSVVQRL